MEIFFCKFFNTAFPQVAEIREYRLSPDMPETCENDIKTCGNTEISYYYIPGGR